MKEATNLPLSDIAHSLRNSLLAVMDSLGYVEEQIIENDLTGAVETLQLLKSISPTMTEAIQELELGLRK